MEQGKLDLVLVCPLWSLEEFGKANGYFKSTDGKEQLRRGNIPGYHLVAPCEIQDWKREIRVVDFRTVFALPFEFLKKFVAESPKRLRLLPPYREHLSQAFARFFMRVGLPAEIASFKKIKSALIAKIRKKETFFLLKSWPWHPANDKENWLPLID